MKTAIIKLCEICSLPVKKSKASDEYAFVKELPDLLKSFRYLRFNANANHNKTFINNKQTS